MNIGFDVDGVLYPWHEIVHEYAVQYLNCTDTYREFWIKIVNGEFSKMYTDNLVNDPNLVTKRFIDPKILEMLNSLSIEHTIFYITARPHSLNMPTEHWFKNNNLPQRENLHITNNGDKIAYVVDNEIDLYVEDRIKNALELNPYTRVILVRQPWNEPIWDDFINMSSVLSLPSVLEGLYGGVKNG